MSLRAQTAVISRQEPTTLLNAVVNICGQVVPPGIWVAMAPLYVRMVGMEAYGFICVYMAIVSVTQGFDLGIAYSVNRELARLRVTSDQQSRLHDAALTFELLFVAMAIVAALGSSLLLLSGDPKWLGLSVLKPSAVRDCKALASICVGLQWLPTFYQNALIGLERQVIPNAIRATEATLTHVGTLLIMAWWQPRLESFFVAQLLASSISVILLRTSLVYALPHAPRPGRLDLNLARRSWRFSSGVGFISATGTLLVNTDKIIVSRIVPLAQFGAYSIAFQLASGVALVAKAVFNTTFPRLTVLAASNVGSELREQYQMSTQLLTVVTVPLALTLSFFAEPIVALWLGDNAAGQSAAPLLRLFAIGMGLNALMHAPFALQLAAGYTRIGVVLNTLLVLLCVPSMLWLVPRHGVIAAGSIWLALMAIYMAVGVPWTHARLVKSVTYHEFAGDVLPGLCLSAAILCAARRLLDPGASALACVCVAALALAMAVLASSLAQSRVRRLLVSSWPRSASPE